MKIIVGISHPKHVYIFKNPINELVKRGHGVKVIAVEKEITKYLLNQFNISYTVIGKNQPKLYRKLLALPRWEYLTYKIAKEFKPDIFVGRALSHLAHVSAIFKKPFIMFEDTEHATKVQKICLPFTNVIVTPDCYKNDFRKRHIRFDGYFELAYLHPNYFKPEPGVLDDLGLSKDDKFIIVRLGLWSAIHDTHSSGIKHGSELKFVKSLEQYGCVFITSERELPTSLQKYRLSIRPENIHSILSFAQLYVGEGETMAVESAILGTPAIDIEAITSQQGTFDITAIHGNADELVNKYKLMFAFSDQNQALKKAIELLEDKQLKKKWAEKREKLLKDKIDVTAFMTEFIEKYPESFYKYCKSRGEENI